MQTPAPQTSAFQNPAPQAGLRFGKQTPGAPAAARTGNTMLLGAAEWMYTMPDRFAASAERLARRNEHGGAFGKTVAKMARGIGEFGKTWLSFDVHEFPKLKIGKWLNYNIAEPSKLMLLFLLYPFTMGPRLIRAYERGQKTNDFREVGDVLRRDGTAITIFLFLLNPLLKALNRGKQALDGLQLVDKVNGKSGSVFTYSQFDNYIVHNADMLTQMVVEGNGRGVKNAVKRLNDRGLSELPEGGVKIAKLIAKIKADVPVFVDAVQGDLHKHGKVSEANRAFAEKIFQQLTEADGLREKALKAAQNGTPQMIKAAKAVQGEFKGFVKQYARMARLPQDALALALCVGAIGWFPVWFNSFWNRKKFAEEQAAKRAADLGSFNPQLTYQALRTHSRIASRFATQPTNPFAQQ